MQSANSACASVEEEALSRGIRALLPIAGRGGGGGGGRHDLRGMGGKEEKGLKIRTSDVKQSHQLQQHEAAAAAAAAEAIIGGGSACLRLLRRNTLGP